MSASVEKEDCVRILRTLLDGDAARVLASTNDKVLASVLNADTAIWVPHGEVATAEVPSAERCLGCLWIIEVLYQG